MVTQKAAEMNRIGAPFCSSKGNAIRLGAVRRMLMLLTGLAAFMCLVVYSGRAVAGETKPRAERPSYIMGEKWSRDDDVYEVVRIENDRYVFSAGPTKEIRLSKDLGVAKIQRGSLATEFDPPLVMPWPLEVGKWGSGTGWWGRDLARITWEVDAYEDVRVPAGTFKTFRIIHEIVTGSGGGLGGINAAQLRLTSWYAPEVRQLIKMVAVYHNQKQADPNIQFQIVAIDRPAPTPALPPPSGRNRWAVVVGVGRHESPEIPYLRYAVPDAEAVHRILTGPAGFKPENVLLMTDRTERKPTIRNLKWALGTFLARSALKDDMVLIFFAGHGAPEVDQRGLERDGLAKYLIPSDADPDDLYSTALPMDELQTIFGRIEAERVVVFLDACYSGAAGGRTFVSKKTRAVNLDDLFLERLTRSKGRAIITASRPTEVSLEVGELGHGLFTYYLLQGLQGAADLNHDGIISLQELYEYVEQEVTQKSRALGGNQHPVMKGELEGVLPLAKVPTPGK